MMNRRGFTFIEMSMCVVIIGLIAMAIGGFSMAISSHWKETNQQQMVQNTGEKSQLTIGSIIEAAKAFGVVNDASRTQMLIWQSDSLNGVSDSIAQLGEMAVLEYDSSRKSIMLYRPDFTQTYDSSSTASYVVQNDDLTNPNVADLYKAQSWHQPGRAIVGPGLSGVSSFEATLVKAAKFTAYTGSARNGVMVSTTLERDGESNLFENLHGVRGGLALAAAPNGSITVSAQVPIVGNVTVDLTALQVGRLLK